MGKEGQCGRGLLNGVDELDELDEFFCVFQFGDFGELRRGRLGFGLTGDTQG